MFFLKCLTPDRAIVRKLSLGHQVQVPFAVVLTLGGDGFLWHFSASFVAALASTLLTNAQNAIASCCVLRMCELLQLYLVNENRELQADLKS